MSGKKTNKNGSTSGPEFNMALVGALGVGKSALTVKYMTRRFIMEYDPDIEDTYVKHDYIENMDIGVHVMDTCDKIDSDPDRYLKWADAFLIIYSITHRQSFDKAREYLDLIGNFLKISGGRELPVALVGNKIDLERYRQVSKAEGESLATEFECLFYETTAAEEYEYVEDMFHSIINEIQRERDLQPLYINEEKTGISLLSPSAASHFSLLRPKSPRTVADRKDDKDTKSVQRKSTTRFKLFNKDFKIFN